MKCFYLSFTISILFLSFSCGSPKNSLAVENPYGVDFKKSKTIGEVLDFAEEQNKLVYLDLYTDWCLPCKVMNEEVYSSKAVIDFFNENFISYKVHGEKDNGPDLVTLFQIKSYPGLLFLNTRGGVIEKKFGGITETQLMEMADRALKTQL